MARLVTFLRRALCVKISHGGIGFLPPSLPSRVPFPPASFSAVVVVERDLTAKPRDL